MVTRGGFDPSSVHRSRGSGLVLPTKVLDADGMECYQGACCRAGARHPVGG